MCHVKRSLKFLAKAQEPTFITISFFLCPPFYSYEKKTLTNGISLFRSPLNSYIAMKFYSCNPEIIHLNIKISVKYMSPFLVFLSDDLAMHTKLALIGMVSCLHFFHK